MGEVREASRSAVRRRDAPRGHEGVAFVATLRGTPGRDVLDSALDALRNLHHGRSQSSGILTHIPDALLRAEFGADLPPAGRYALGFVFHTDPAADRHLIAEAASAEGFAVLTWREVPLNDTMVDIEPRETMPEMSQVILTPAREVGFAEFDAGLYRIRKRVEAVSDVYFASLSRTTVVYKGLIAATRLAVLFTDLADPLYKTEIAVVHSCSSNEYTEWHHAQPHRILAHDGKVHSASANRAWLAARLPLMQSPLVEGITPRLRPGELIEGALDEFVELLHRSGRGLTHALRMVIPEQWGRRMSPQERDFYDYAATVVEPWEGSGVTCFADGYLIGAVLDRHGTASGRYWVTESGLVVFASENGVVDLDPSTVTKKGRLAPGELIAVDTVIGNLLPSGAVRAQIASLHPYGQWLRGGVRELGGAGGASDVVDARAASATYHLSKSSRAVVAELAEGKTSTGARGPSRELTFYDRFRSRRSSLTTPHLDPVLMPPAPRVHLGPEHNILTDGPEHARKVLTSGLVMSTADLEELGNELPVATVDATYPAPEGGPQGREVAEALERVRAEVARALEGGAAAVVLSNRGALAGGRVALPALLTVGAVHQHLLGAGHRARVSLIADAGEAVEPKHVARLLEAGAEVVVPFGGEALAGPDRAGTYLSALNTSVYHRVLASGAGDYRAYQGNNNFHVVGLHPDLVDEFFSGAERALGTFGLAELAEEFSRSPRTLPPLQDLLEVATGTPIPVDEVEGAEEIGARIRTGSPLIIDETRRGATLVRVATAKQILLAPPAHHDSVGPNALRILIEEMRKVNPSARVNVRVGADLTSDLTAILAIEAGADVINLVDGEYEWVFGLLSLRQSAELERATIAVGTPVRTATEIFIAAALGASEFTLDPRANRAQVVSELRVLLARSGTPTIAALAHRDDVLDWSRAVDQWREAGVNLSASGRRPHAPAPAGSPDESQSLGSALTALTAEAIRSGKPARINTFVANTDVSFGARLAGEIARARGPKGLPPDTIRLTLTGSTGTSLGAYGAPGMTIIVQGEAGDFVGKGLSGARIVVRPETTAGYVPQGNAIAGSAIGYGASSGEIYLAGEVGERLGAHNRGATIVCEGAGDVAGYRMHGGTLVILGDLGVHAGAGMDGGVIYALDLPADSLHRGLGADRLLVSPPDDTDLRVLTAILADHVEATNSRVATLLLSEPDELQTRFSKIHRVGYDPEQNCDGSTTNAWDRVLNATTQR